MKRLQTRSQPVPVKATTVGGMDFLSRIDPELDGVVILGDGCPVGSMRLEDQMEVYSSISDSLRRAALVENDTMGVSFLDCRRPLDLVWMRAKMEARLHPDIFAPAALNKPDAERTRQERADVNSYQYHLEQLATIKEVCRQPTQAAVLTIKRPSVLKKAQGMISSRDASRLPIRQIADVAVAGLSQHISNLEVLDFPALHDFIRGAWDVDDRDSEKYHQARYNGETASTKSLLHYPQVRMLREHDHCWTDNTCHTVLRVISLPEEVLVNEAHARFEFEIPWFSRALVSETINYKYEYRWTSHLRKGRSQLRDKFEMIEDHRSRDLDQKLDRRTQELYRDRFSQNFAILIAISATNLNDLENYVDQVKSHLRFHKMAAQRIEGKLFQFPALWSATTGMDML